MVDSWLGGILEAGVAESKGDRAGTSDGVALVAVGSYGRVELCPRSDLDVLLVHRGRRDVAELARRVWYPIWDAGLELDHSVRTLGEAIDTADRDLKTMLGLLDARFVAGDAALADDLITRARERWSRRAGKWLPILATSVADRHEHFGEAAFLLEPELKESRGGLRDASMIAALAAAVPVVDLDEHPIADERAAVLAARVELHRVAGRAIDRLLLQYQDGVAANLDVADADELMAHLATACRQIAWAGDDAWQRANSFLAGPARRGSSGRDRVVGPGIVRRDGALDVAGDAPLATDPSLALRLGAEAAYAGLPIARGALARMATEGADPDAPWSEETRQALVSLLGAGEAMIPVFETLDRYDVVTRYLPEWDAVRSRPQRNAFHRFTVDRHLLECVVQAGHLARQVARPDLLLLGALMHDLGKGFPGDHTDAGVEVAARVVERMGLSAHDAGVVVTLVRLHLLLPAAATSRDLSDPATAESVAADVGSVETLDLLEALTEADSIATGATAWSSWKADLLRSLVARVRAVLLGEEHPSDDDERSDEVAALAARANGRILVEADGTTLHVVAPDRPGLLSAVVGLLVVHGQGVRVARVWSTDDGVAVEEFELESRLGTRPDWSRFDAELEEVVAGRRDLDVPIAERARTYVPKPTAARPAEPRVIVHEGASSSATVVEVRAPDSVGLLYRITSVISTHGFDIGHAKVLTLGHEVVDTFYLRDANGKVLTADDAAAIQDALNSELVDRRD